MVNRAPRVQCGRQVVNRPTILQVDMITEVGLCTQKESMLSNRSGSVKCVAETVFMTNRHITVSFG